MWGNKIKLFQNPRPQPVQESLPAKMDQTVTGLRRVGAAFSIRRWAYRSHETGGPGIAMRTGVRTGDKVEDKAASSIQDLTQIPTKTRLSNQVGQNASLMEGAIEFRIAPIFTRLRIFPDSREEEIQLQEGKTVRKGTE